MKDEKLDVVTGSMEQLSNALKILNLLSFIVLFLEFELNNSTDKFKDLADQIYYKIRYFVTLSNKIKYYIDNSGLDLVRGENIIFQAIEATLDNEKSIIFMGLINQFGIGIQKNKESAKKWFRLSKGEFKQEARLASLVVCDSGFSVEHLEIVKKIPELSNFEQVIDSVTLNNWFLKIDKKISENIPIDEVRFNLSVD
jgi:hypothetical protein